MSERDNGGNAFPSEGEGHGNPMYHSPGMTLRDWFAGMALQGILAQCAGARVDTNRLSDFAVAAYKLSDEMITERNKSL